MAKAVLEAVEKAGVDQEEANKAWKGFKGTWPDWTDGSTGSESDEEDEVSEKDDQASSPKKLVWFFSAAQFTYNGTTGDWASKDNVVLEALFARFKAFLLTCLAPFVPKGISATMERSTRTDEHVHLHCYFHLSKPFRAQGQNALQSFAFESVAPHVEQNTARGSAFDTAVKRGHFYVYIDKIGSIFNWTDFPPFVSYGVESWWVDNWYKQGKLTNKVYLDVVARVGVGFQRRLADIKAAERFMREAAVEAHISAEQAVLNTQMCNFKQYPEVDKFIGLFASNVAKHRRPMLALIGGTNLGKSMLAADILMRIGGTLGTESFLEVTVEGSPHLDLIGFDHRFHSGVLLDGVGDAFFLRAHREVLQGRPKVCKGAQSATNVYAYCFTLARRAVIATFDLSADNLAAFTDHHWLSDERNVIKLHLDTPAFEEASSQGASAALPPVPSSPAHHATKRRPVGSPSSGYSAVPVFPSLHS